MTVEHGGIIIVVIGTICLAFSTEISNKYEKSAKTSKEKNQWKDLVNRAQDGSYLDGKVKIFPDSLKLP